VKKLDNDRSYYNDFKSEAQVHWTVASRCDPDPEGGYLYINADLQNDEHDRLCVVLPWIKIEIENNCLSKELLEELEIYYEDFNKGLLDKYLYEHEYEEIKKDLYWCYEHKDL